MKTKNLLICSVSVLAVSAFALGIAFSPAFKELIARIIVRILIWNFRLSYPM